MAKKVPTQYRIKKGLFLFLLTFAIVADFIQFLLSLLYLSGILALLGFLLSSAITIFFMLGYSLFFLMNGVNPLSGKKAARKVLGFLTTLLSENIPVLSQFAPSLSLWTFFVIHGARKEDEIRAVELAKKAEEDAKIQMAAMKALAHRRRQIQEMEAAQIEELVANDNSRATNDARDSNERTVGPDRRPAANDNRPSAQRKAA